ncbi:MAG: sel1 repeat family protein [Rhodocyclaceae bacterium]|nr:sel1 repeat family protein [Rhodocyclaceae bacterium]
MREETVGAGEAALKLGERFRCGVGVDQDLWAARHCYGVSARLGDIEGQNNLGTMLLNGLGGAPDAKAATRWYRAAAEQGQAVAQFNLAMRHLYGSGTERDDAIAARWLMLSAEQGYIEAIGELGTLFRFGRGVQTDLLVAAELHIAAAQAGDDCAHGNLAAYQGELETLALDGSREAALRLSQMADWGLGCDEDPAQCWAWLSWAREGCRPDPEEDEGVRTAVIDAMDFFRSVQPKAVRLAGESWLSEKVARHRAKNRGSEPLATRA